MALKFQRLDKVRFHRNSTCGGSSYGREGDMAIILSGHEHSQENLHYYVIELYRGGEYNKRCNAYERDLELYYQELKYDPNQQNDTDDDI